MEKMKRFIECLIPVTACNLKCSYCYIIQRDHRTLEIPQLKYSPETIGKALSKERLGGTCYISICGAGETLVPDYMIDITRNILKQGHFVNITTNGTLTKRFDQLCELPSDLLERLHIAFSFHYLELKRLNLLDTFFDNINRMKESGASVLVQINLCDEYIPYIKEIQNICMEKIGALPQVAATRREDTSEKIRLMTEHSEEEYKKYGESFESPLFDMTMKNFNVRRREFCYAGDWTFTLNLMTGVLSKCYGVNAGKQNIFDDVEKPIKFEALGQNCHSAFCFNSTHFMSLGVIPSVETPTYASLRNRKEAKWYTKKMEEFLNSKLKESNEEYSDKRKKKITRKNKLLKGYYQTYYQAKKPIKFILKKIGIKK